MKSSDSGIEKSFITVDEAVDVINKEGECILFNKKSNEVKSEIYFPFNAILIVDEMLTMRKREDISEISLPLSNIAQIEYISNEGGLPLIHFTLANGEVLVVILCARYVHMKLG